MLALGCMAGLTLAVPSGVGAQGSDGAEAAAEPEAAGEDAAEQPPAAEPLPAAPSAAELADMKAKDLFKVGSLQFDEGNYELALTLFRTAYEKSDRPQLLYNIALSAERVGKLEEAIDAYRRYIEANPEGERVQESRTRIRSLEAMQQKLVPAEAASSVADGQDGAGGLQPAMPGTPAGGDRAEARPWYKQWWVWTAAGVLVTGALAGALIVNQDPGFEQPPLVDGRDGQQVTALTVQR